MKTKINFLQWIMTLLLIMITTASWSQTSQTVTQTLCPGTEPYLVTPGNAANTFLWSISTGTSGVDWTITSANTVATNIIWANPLVPKTYHLSLKETNGDGCQTIVSVDVTVNPRPAAPIASLTQPSCAVATGTINVTNPAPAAGITYTVTGTTPVVAAVTNSTGIFAGLTPGVYDVTTSNVYACTSAATIVTINSQPITPTAPIAGLIQPSCTIATGTVNVTTPVPAAGITYTITGTTPFVSAVNNSTGIFAGLTPGIYNVTTTNGVGCTSLATSITINTQPPTPAAPVAILTQPTCFVPTGTVNITSPIPAAGITYTITGTTPFVTAVTNSTGVFAGLNPGNYDITTTNSDGCTSLPTSITINPSLSTPIAPTANITQPSCAVATGIVNVTAPLPGVGITYSIIGTAPVVPLITNATGIFTGLATGVYNLTTSNSTGCISAATIITINDQPITPNTSAIFHN
ncbi:MAG: hypothetical protein ACOYO1_02710 [Bacteroidales bacterium]